jgi:hypothetical protein
VTILLDQINFPCGNTSILSWKRNFVAERQFGVFLGSCFFFWQWNGSSSIFRKPRRFFTLTPGARGGPEIFTRRITLDALFTVLSMWCKSIAGEGGWPRKAAASVMIISGPLRPTDRPFEAKSSDGRGESGFWGRVIAYYMGCHGRKLTPRTRRGALSEFMAPPP